jgi:hypothetical protein
LSYLHSVLGRILLGLFVLHEHFGCICVTKWGRWVYCVLWCVCVCVCVTFYIPSFIIYFRFYESIFGLWFRPTWNHHVFLPGSKDRFVSPYWVKKAGISMHCTRAISTYGNFRCNWSRSKFFALRSLYLSKQVFWHSNTAVCVKLYNRKWCLKHISWARRNLIIKTEYN